MLVSEEIMKDIHISHKALLRNITKNTLPDTETFKPGIRPESSNNQISLFNNISPEREVSNNNRSIKITQFDCTTNNSKRTDRKGNEICKHGKQRITFCDKITNNKLVDIINIESFKQYNKIEEVNYTDDHSCCIIV